MGKMLWYLTLGFLVRLVVCGNAMDERVYRADCWWEKLGAMLGAEKAEQHVV